MISVGKLLYNLYNMVRQKNIIPLSDFNFLNDSIINLKMKEKGDYVSFPAS